MSAVFWFCMGWRCAVGLGICIYIGCYITFTCGSRAHAESTLTLITLLFNRSALKSIVNARVSMIHQIPELHIFLKSNFRKRLTISSTNSKKRIKRIPRGKWCNVFWEMTMDINHTWIFIPIQPFLRLD